MVAMVKLAPCCELAHPAPQLSLQSISTSLHYCSVFLSVHLSLHALATASPFPFFFLLPNFFVTFPASSYSSLPHLSFMPQWPPHRLQTGPERHATFEASWQDDWAEAGGTRRLNVTTQNPDIYVR